MSIRIDGLNPTALPSRDHVVPAMRDGLTVKLTVGQILDLLIDGAPETLDTLNEIAAALNDDANLAATLTAAIALKADKTDTNTHALTGKTTPVDADEIRIADSAASFGFKKLTFANLKAWVAGIASAYGRKRFATVTLSAAAHDITSIPAGVKCITLTYDITQTNAGSLSTVQLGTAGGMVTSGYDSTAETSPGGASPVTSNVTGGFNFLSSGLSAVIFGKMTIERIGTTNQWVATASHRYSTGAMAREVGKITLGAELTQLRLSVSGGTLTGSLDVTVEYG